MKRKLLIVFMICFFAIGHLAVAQNYIPIPLDNSSFWRVKHGYTFICDGGDGHANYKVGGDTVYNGYTYKIILSGGVDSGYAILNYPWCTPFATAYNYYNNFKIAYLRNDSANKKVYWLNGGFDELIYDFNLSVGDSIISALPIAMGTSPLIIDSISSILLNDGLYHKFFWYNSNYCNMNTASLIEGIGSVNGLLGPLTCFENGSVLTCFNHNGTTVYTDPFFTQPCIDDTPINEIVQGQNISLYPNPFKENFSVSGIKFPAEIKMLDVFGREVLSEQLTTVNSKPRTSKLPPGIYFVKLIADGKEVVKKVVKCE